MPGNIRIKNLHFCYQGRNKPTLSNINLEIGRGEFLLITGPTGCGKSTLLKCLNGIIPHHSGGEMDGVVMVNGLNTKDVPLSELCRQVGLVLQSPDDQIFSTIVEDEVAFGPENLSFTRDKIEKEISKALKAVGLNEQRLSRISNLSGGQKQRVAIASMLSMEPKILCLDEPFSQLDPKGMADVLEVIKKLNTHLGMTIIIVEHRIHEISHLIDRLVIMDEGEIIMDKPKDSAFFDLGIYRKLGLRVPESAELFGILGYPERPLTLEEGIRLFERKDILRIGNYQWPTTNCVASETEHTIVSTSYPPVVRIENLNFFYDKQSLFHLEDINLEIREGEIVALMGSNGSGKSSLLYLMASILKPQRGKVEIIGMDTKNLSPYSLAGKAGLVFQNSDLMLLADTVYDEVAFGPKNFHKDETNMLQKDAKGNKNLQDRNVLPIDREGFLNKKIIEKQIEKVLSVMTIEKLKYEVPMSLSKGQRLRVAVASILSLEPRVILLDEPTTGQDKTNIEQMMEHLISSGKTIIFCTHDVQTALRYAQRVIVMSKGKIIGDGSPLEIFKQEDIMKEASLLPPFSLLMGKYLGFPALYSNPAKLAWVIKQRLGIEGE